MDRYLSRKSFVTTLGVAGLGLGMTAVALCGAPAAGAQDADAPSFAEAAEMHAQFEEVQAELYAAFTAALAEELGTGDAAQVDGGIRAALAAVVDGFAGDDLVTAGQATALKALIESAEVPVGPGPMMGHERFRFAGGGPPMALPVEDVEVTVVEGELPADGRRAMAERFYPDFTAALASELGAGSADEVDGAIRLAMISVIDGLNQEDLPMPIPTDALKAMVATSESPLAPAMLFGAHPGIMIRAFHGHGGGPGFHGRDGDDDGGWFGERGSDRDESADDASEASEETDDEPSA